jgi:hypothetical protein
MLLLLYSRAGPIRNSGNHSFFISRLMLPLIPGVNDYFASSEVLVPDIF